MEFCPTNPNSRNVTKTHNNRAIAPAGRTGNSLHADPQAREEPEPAGAVGRERFGFRRAARAGARDRALSLARKYGCRAALLKEKSPSCGTGKIHNGNFDGGLTDGYGIAAAMLAENGIAVFGESELEKLIAFCKK